MLTSVNEDLFLKSAVEDTMRPQRKTMYGAPAGGRSACSGAQRVVGLSVWWGSACGELCPRRHEWLETKLHARLARGPVGLSHIAGAAGRDRVEP